jgi:selenocysteine lyase/cysteine desulfurase
VERRILANTARLMDGLADIRGVEIVSRQEAGRRSGIVSFRHAGKPVIELHDELQQRGLRCSLRNHAIRLSPHCYQDASVMERVLALIEAAISR